MIQFTFDCPPLNNMSKKLFLQWNDFKENAIGSIGSLKGDSDFLDVTLACEDGKQVEAHKMILAMSSPYFQNLLKRNKHPHPLIYMRGVKSEDLLAIIDFLYFGEANVTQENLDSFLAIAEELQLKGLMGNVSGVEAEMSTEFSLNQKKNKIKSSVSQFSRVSHNNSNEDILNINKNNRTVALTSYISGNIQELDEKCNSMMEKTLKKKANHPSLPLYRCMVCGKEATNSDLKKHIEAYHLEGVSIPCNFCEKTFRSRDAKGQHTRIYHKSL